MASINSGAPTPKHNFLRHCGNIVVCGNTKFNWDDVSKVKIGSEAHWWMTYSGVRCTVELDQQKIDLGEYYTLNPMETSYDIPNFVK